MHVGGGRQRSSTCPSRSPAAAFVHRRGRPALVPAADGRVPLDPGAAQGRRAQPALIGAAYGVVVAVFQWGWGKPVRPGSLMPIVSFVPMLMFAVLFGLSMDYEVFLLSRIREEYLKTGITWRASSSGSSTTRVITSAALIMIASSRLRGAGPGRKMFGVGSRPRYSSMRRSSGSCSCRRRWSARRRELVDSRLALTACCRR